MAKTTINFEIFLLSLVAIIYSEANKIGRLSQYKGETWLKTKSNGESIEREKLRYHEQNKSVSPIHNPVYDRNRISLSFFKYITLHFWNRFSTIIDNSIDLLLLFPNYIS